LWVDRPERKSRKRKRGWARGLQENKKERIQRDQFLRGGQKIKTQLWKRRKNLGDSKVSEKEFLQHQFGPRMRKKKKR